jgi:hypothetical protein
MGVREYIFNLITTDPEMNDLGINADHTFTTHSVDTPQVRPLCILRWQAVNPGLATRATQGSGLSEFPVNQRILQVWVHEDRAIGDFGRIDASLKRLRALLTGVEGVNVGGPDSWLSTIAWEGDSDDLDDDVVGTISRNAQFRLTGSAI